MASTGPSAEILQLLVGYSMFCLLEGALVWNLYAEWLGDPNNSNPSSEKHLQFAVHSFLAMLMTGGVLTYLFADIDWGDTPLTRHYGYNDITIVLDYPPSTYVMPAYWFVTGSGFLLYVLEDTKRLLRQPGEHPGQTCSYVVNATLAAVTMLFSITLAIRAQQDIVVHTFPVLCLVLVLPCPFVMQAVEVFFKRHELKRPDRSYGLLIIFVSWFTFASLLKGGLSVFAFFVRPVNPSFAKPLDGLWLFLALVAPCLLHPAPGGSYQQVPGAEAGPRPGNSGAAQGGPSTRCLVAACTGLALLAVAGVAYATYAQRPLSVAKQAEWEASSAAGYNTVHHSRHCAHQGEKCHCPGGFVLFGRGEKSQYFLDGSAYAEWDVYPVRIQDSILCTTDILGNPFVFSDTEECRCVRAELQCTQLSEPTANGCGTGASAGLLDVRATPDERSCCSRHDRCYGLCDHTKQRCDEEFDQCLDRACQRNPGPAGQQMCAHKIVMLKKAVHSADAQAAYSMAERELQRWALVNPGAPLPHAENSTSKRDTGRSREPARAGNIEKQPWPGHRSVERDVAFAPKFNCHTGEAFWQVEWSAEKKKWCCKHESLGCMESLPAAGTEPHAVSTTTTAPEPAEGQERATTVSRQATSRQSTTAAPRPATTTTLRLLTTAAATVSPALPQATLPPVVPKEVLPAAPAPSQAQAPAPAPAPSPAKVVGPAQVLAPVPTPEPRPAKPFNCLTTDAWSDKKTVWCCTNLGLGCEHTTRAPRRLVPLPVSGTWSAGDLVIDCHDGHQGAKAVYLQR